jgi:RNA polymerase sigma-70 factor (ECF subfamily)
MVSGEVSRAERVLRWPQSVADFDALIDATQNRLIQFAFCRLHSLADAEDVVQDVFVQAYRDRERHRDVDHVVPFLFRMVENRSIDLLRRRAGQAAVSLPQPAVDSGEREQWIEGLLDRLPSRQAAVIRLRFYGELPFDAVARSVGCSVPTVKSRFRYGLQNSGSCWNAKEVCGDLPGISKAARGPFRLRNASRC